MVYLGHGQDIFNAILLNLEKEELFHLNFKDITDS